MNQAEKIRQLSEALGELIRLLSQEGLRKDFPSLEAAYGISVGLGISNATDLPVDAITELKSLSLAPFTGTVGSLSDLVIWRSDESDRIRVNERLGELREAVLTTARELSSE